MKRNKNNEAGGARGEGPNKKRGLLLGLRTAAWAYVSFSAAARSAPISTPEIPPPPPPVTPLSLLPLEISGLAEKADA